jgi:hypothetical protein
MESEFCRENMRYMEFGAVASFDAVHRYLTERTDDKHVKYKSEELEQWKGLTR